MNPAHRHAVWLVGGLVVIASAVQAVALSVEQVVDETSAASDWRVEGDELIQTVAVAGGDPHDPYGIIFPGTLALVGQAGGDSGQVTFEVRTVPADLNSAVGFVFGFRDADNYHRLRIPSGKGFCEVSRKVEGRWEVLHRSFLTLRQERWREVAFRYTGGKALLELERQTIGLNAYDPAGGGFGFYAWNTTDARFRNVLAETGTVFAPQLVVLHPAPRFLSISGDLVIQSMIFASPGGRIWTRYDLDADGPSPQSVAKGLPLMVEFQRLAPGEHHLTAHLTIDDATLNTATVRNIGVGDLWVAVGDDATWGTDDDLARDDVSLDERNSFGGWTPVLGDRLAEALGRPVLVACEGRPGRSVAAARSETAELIRRYGPVTGYLVLLGAGDLANSAQLAVEDATQTFQADLEGLVDELAAAGGEVVLGRIAAGATADAERLAAFDAVIDRVAASRGLRPPPDFAPVFAPEAGLCTPAGLPNGEGYVRMAAIWAEALLAGTVVDSATP